MNNNIFTNDKNFKKIGMAIIAILVVGTALYNVKLQSITKYNAQQQRIVDEYNLSSEKQIGNVTIDSEINGNEGEGTNKDIVILQSDTSIIEIPENPSTIIGSNENIVNDNGFINSTLSDNSNNIAGVSEMKASIASGENNTSTSEVENVTCYIEIRCDAISRNPSKWTNSKKQMSSSIVPIKGVILEKMEISVKDNSTVFDVLKKATIINNIYMDASQGYIKSINQLEEFDAGKGSGWLYWVNNTSPKVACSSNIVKNGDTIKWQYFCDYGDEFDENGNLK